MDVTFSFVRSGRGLTKLAGDLVDIFESSSVATYNVRDDKYQINGGVKGNNAVFLHLTHTPMKSIAANRRLLNPMYYPPLAPESQDEPINPFSGGIKYEKIYFVETQSRESRIRSQLDTEGELTLTWTEGKNYIVNRETGMPLSDDDLR